ncbi:MAG: O-antigen ligase family protein [Bacteroidetes bacterium]|nr:O-antigen ligase family protein [Bacteroidota bacterium]
MTNWLRQQPPLSVVFCGFAALLAVSVWLWVGLGNPLLLAIPLVVLMAGILLMDYRIVYALLLFAIPFSEQLEIVPGLNLDIPTEPLLAIFMVICAYQVVTRGTITRELLTHPLVCLLALQLLWAALTTLPSPQVAASLKFIVQRLWYIGAFVLLPVYLLRQGADYRRILQVIGYGLFFALLPLCIWQTLDGLDWQRVNSIVGLFFVNHVVYGCIAAMAIPLFIALFIWRRQAGHTGGFWLLAAGVAAYATIFSYTRASWLAALLLPLLWLVIRARLFAYFMWAALLGTAVLVYWILDQNRYLDYAPHFEETVTHKELDKHLKATMEGRDVSSMERVYRWVAAKRMVFEHPLLGTGPDSFYPEYFSYTVETYRTYVSDNPEQSTTHNYFLMVAAEQGVPGTLLFLAGVVYFFLLANRLYMRSTDPAMRTFLMGAMLIQCMFLFHLLMNDLVEENKLSYLFWLLQGMVLHLHISTRAANRAADSD